MADKKTEAARDEGTKALNSQTTESELLTPSNEGFPDILIVVFYSLINLPSICHTHTEGTVPKVRRPGRAKRVSLSPFLSPQGPPPRKAAARDNPPGPLPELRLIPANTCLLPFLKTHMEHNRYTILQLFSFHNISWRVLHLVPKTACHSI